MKIFFRKFLIFSVVLMVLSVCADTAKACSCTSDETVDKEFAKYPNVAVLKVESVEKENAKDSYLLKVARVFKGDLKVGETLNFTYGLICAWSFTKENVGDEFLFYLDERPKDDEMWTAAFCTRSGRVKARSSDLLYLEKEEKMRGKTRLSGMLDKIIEKPEDDDRYFFYSLANHKIRITGKGKNIELITDENGAYEIYDLPAGTYKIIPEKVDGFNIGRTGNPSFVEVKIKAKSHTEQIFFFEIDNAVSGKVLDEKGMPMENVCLDLVPVKNAKAKNYSKSNCTNKSGLFEISAIPEGVYILVINKDGEPRLYEPFGTFYYPNVKTIDEATEISVRANFYLRDLKIIPPEIIEKVSISGTLLFKDGQPVREGSVSLIEFKNISEYIKGYIWSDFKVKTDKNGRFSIEVLKGQEGILIGSMYSFVGEYKDCPEIDEAIRQKGKSAQRLDTAGKNVKATENLSGIELKFPFTSCQKAK